ncbi:hypothetical protein GGS20DRAFT_548495 [Poronia punctata]|nr:hypothetical protein GGS20DRAFT_548495 [Poronia punctata]
MPPSDNPERLALPCGTCRERHLNCDRSIPQCSRCSRDGRECKIEFKFKPSTNKFDKNQRWMLLPRELQFVDRTRYLLVHGGLEDPTTSHSRLDPRRTGRPGSSLGDNEVHLSNEILSVAQLCSSVAETSWQQPTQNGSPRHPIPTCRAQGLSTSPLVQPERPIGPGLNEFEHAQPVARISGSHAPSYANVPTSRIDEREAMPLKSRTEAALFRHYIQHIAVCLDCCDPLKYFELVVPERASNCDTLRNAIFAIAARHLSHTTGFDPLASNRYHDECLKYLIPMMDHASVIEDENLFAATIILRMLEEMDGSLTGQDNYSHLLGIHAFVNVGDQYLAPNSLRAASFWVGLRQEIYIAILTQKPVKLNLNNSLVDRSVVPADDSTWSNRAVVLLADVVNSCFGHFPMTSQRWQSLCDAAEKWTRAKPPSFRPFFHRQRAGYTAFPEIWHGSSCHIIGIQHHILAQLFLLQFDPWVPRVGTNRRAAMQRTTERIEALMRDLCGLGISNQWTPPAMFTACIGIAMFGDQFNERSDQEALADFLMKTETAHARPTATIQRQLKKAWGWTSDKDEGQGH